MTDIANPSKGPDYYRGIAQVGDEAHTREALRLAADEIQCHQAAAREAAAKDEADRYFAIISRPNLVGRKFGEFTDRAVFEKGLREAIHAYPDATISVVTLMNGRAHVEAAKEFLFDPDNPTEFMSAEDKASWEAEFGAPKRKRARG